MSKCYPPQNVGWGILKIEVHISSICQGEKHWSTVEYPELVPQIAGL